MILTYFKQAWQMIRHNKLFSAIYIAGTALAIASTTIVALTYYVKLAPIYPESARSRMVVIDRMHYSSPRSAYQGHYGYLLVRDLLKKYKNAEEVTAWVDLYDDTYVKASDGLTDIKVACKPTDPAFFRVYDYDFVAGRPFSEAEFENGEKVAVISDDIARRIFDSADSAVGRDILVNYTPHRVTGVVRAGSAICTRSYAQVITHYNTPQYTETDSNVPYAGNFCCTAITDNPDALREETADYQRRVNSAGDGCELNLLSQPFDFGHWALAPGQSREEFSWSSRISSLLLIMLIMLLVPALNLSGMISSRMDMRSAELGVRKSYGACRSALLSQILWENMLLTGIGAVAGLVACWLLLYASDGTLLIMGDVMSDHPEGDIALGADILFAPAVFGIVLVLCMVLNLLSAMLPAWLSLRRPIVQSLKDK